MSWRTSTTAVYARNVARFMGARRISFLYNSGKSYEEAYHHSLTSDIKSGDIVWDVGANIGHYTRIFCKLVADTGFVYAFEPSPANLKILHEVPPPGGGGNLLVLAKALGAKNGSLYLTQGDDEIGATSRVSENHDAQTVAVEVAAADFLVESGFIKLPNVIKIDTEGYELEVLQGMESSLKSPCVHTVGVEVHFGLLAKRGMNDAPRKIEEILKKAGFQLNFTDASHLVARK